MTRLSPEERQFFSLVSQAAQSNPFSDERTEIDLKISGLFPDVSYEERLGETIAETARWVDKLQRKNKADISLFSGEDRTLVENAFLFDIFHKFIDRFDQFIVDQLAAGNRSLKVPFAGEALEIMEKRGFNSEESLRYFALFFQVRRAYFFIDHHLVGRSTCMKDLRRKLWNNVFTHDIDIYNRFLWNRMEDFSTLILGETGTGKGTAAAAIGRSGFIPYDAEKNRFVERFPDAFVSLNLSQYSEALIESELFGHKKGAFTGAVEDHRGAFDRCSPNGAIFLDEIGEISHPIQIKLLRVIEDRTFSPVGSHDSRRFKGRVIAATNRSMKTLRHKKMLRDDFYYRLCSDVIVVPPLRQRIEEDPLELDDLLAHTVTYLLGKPSEEIVQMIKKGIIQHLGLEYPWPGNVRELAQCTRQMLLNRFYTANTPEDYDETDPVKKLQEGIAGGKLDAQSLLSAYCRLLYRRLGTYEAAARRLNLDRRTVKKYVQEGGS